ncbi:PIG-L family deacetylase [Clostridioides difficile]|uniref:PIG-L family deacetylase n=1 Tax=Clostridioides difficile TaxID=1496 RepID=UPI001ED38DED|nr:PIG-L family deacetylase [Clostridioides difficile]EGT2202064.1 PIG-L family deacetylase [Clostridioides difficile]EGT4668282.1 PIG-L family deacetylase [Clostridioides difficile]UUC41016.1 PIG-L family deacetylase [Clostridioides difficile]
MTFKNKKFTISKYRILSIILALCLILTGFSSYMNYSHKKFKDYVVFYVQHQDDEVLWAGSAIVNAIKERGKNHVFVVLVSTGCGISVFDKYKKYENLTDIQKSEYRNREFLASLNSLGVRRENIILLPETNTNGNTDFNYMEKIAINFEENFKNVTHIAHTYKLDDHLQHLKNGSVIQNLYNAGKIKDAKYFVKPKFADKITFNNKIVYKAHSTEDYEKVKNACQQYKIVDELEDREGIGYKSDHKSFDKLLRNKDVPAILHTPNL